MLPIIYQYSANMVSLRFTDPLQVRNFRDSLTLQSAGVNPTVEHARWAGVAVLAAQVLPWMVPQIQLHLGRHSSYGLRSVLCRVWCRLGRLTAVPHLLVFP